MLNCHKLRLEPSQRFYHNLSTEDIFESESGVNDYILSSDTEF